MLEFYQLLYSDALISIFNCRTPYIRKKMVGDAPVRIINLDILKPHKPDIIEFGKAIEKEKSVEAVNLSVYAIDEKTESVKLIVEGKNLNFDNIRRIIEDFGAVVHSIDKVVISRREIIEFPGVK